MHKEVDCKCLKIIGHLDAVKWLLYKREYRPSVDPLSLGDWTSKPHLWLRYVESNDGVLADDDVLKSTDSRYWSLHDVQRYFVGDLHCENVLFPYQYPNFRMPSQLGSHFWRTSTAVKLPAKLYMKQLHTCLEITLKKMETKQSQMDRLIVCDQLIRIDRLDFFRRKTFFRILLNIISFQERLQLVSFENLQCSRLEGVRLIQQLACFNADTLKYLFLWRFVRAYDNPLLVNYCYITGSGAYLPRPESRQCFLRSLAELRNLRVLALEYSHIADGTGAAVITILPVIQRPHFRLQLICREEHTPGRNDAALGAGGYGIPDTAWRRVNMACPDLYLLMAFYLIRDYDHIRRFLSPSIPLRETHLELGIDLAQSQRQTSDINCFVRHIAYYYACTLVTLSIHQWRFDMYPLRRVFELMPRLVRFFYVGSIEDEVELRRMLTIVACGVTNKLKQLFIQIQYNESNKDYWTENVKKINEDFQGVMCLYDINFCLCLYEH